MNSNNSSYKRKMLWNRARHPASKPGLRKGWRLAALALAIGLLAAATGIGAQQPPKPPETLFQRLCRLLRINPKLASALARPRGGDEIAPHGKRVFVTSIDGKKSQMLWDCGECWSPAVWRGDITVVRSDGIWRISRDGGTAPQKVLAKKEIAVQTGLIADRVDTMLAMKASGSGDTIVYSFFTADLANGRVGPAPEDVADPYRQTDVAAFPRLDAFRGSRIVSTSRSRPLRLLIATISNESDRALNTDLPIAPKPGVERFDPIWLDDDMIAYIERDM